MHHTDCVFQAHEVQAGELTQYLMQKTIRLQTFITSRLRMLRNPNILIEFK